jgi:hypothetical protein
MNIAIASPLRDAPRFRRRLACASALATALAAGALGLPAGASASPALSCHGHTEAVKGPGAEDALVYKFGCSEPITGFSLVSSRQLSFFEVSAEVFAAPQPGQPLEQDPKDGFECSGDIPGFGLSCNGGYQSGGRFIQGGYVIDRAVCQEDRPTASIVVVGADGKLVGPFALGRPQGCKTVKKPAASGGKPTKKARKPASPRKRAVKRVVKHAPRSAATSAAARTA